MDIAHIAHISDAAQTHMASARLNNLHISEERLTLADNYRCHWCGGNETELIYVGVSCGIVTISATCAKCAQVFVIDFVELRAHSTEASHVSRS
jgi:hypothetical protein